ncbi:MAG TPA: class II fumarate hydratase [Candidatus Dormibacteraeota bacterium]|nr:class II fumarate hydratase [Candidatus Dormibacteraeota bacterium]
MSDGETRLERDSMGELPVPASAYYGAQTQRAVLNFPISSLTMPEGLIRAHAQLKAAAAEANRDLGLLDPKLAGAIVEAAGEVAEGKHPDQFPIDVYQTGSGTSTNMNLNEVIANRASEILGGERGSKLVHPNDHVNMGQSSNDEIPTSIHVAALVAIDKELIPALEHLQAALEKKSVEFWDVIKTGRTHLQDATPIRLGQEFKGWAGQVERGIKRLKVAEQELGEVALGGTAVGTGVNTHQEFAARVTGKLSDKLGVRITETENHFQAQSSLDNVVSAMGALRTVAVSLYKIANDIRWLGSGPRAGLGELAIPAVQPGSSIMPGKVNPVIAESVTMVTAQVIGNDAVIAFAGAAGSIFELNLMLPVAAHNLLSSIDLLTATARNFADQCVAGIEATSRGPEMVEQGLMLATALAPAIGYDAAADLAKTAFKEGKTIRELARERTDLSEEQLAKLLDAAAMTEPGGSGPGGG